MKSSRRRSGQINRKKKQNELLRSNASSKRAKRNDSNNLKISRCLKSHLVGRRLQRLHSELAAERKLAEDF